MFVASALSAKKNIPLQDVSGGGGAGRRGGGKGVGMHRNMKEHVTEDLPVYNYFERGDRPHIYHPYRKFVPMADDSV